ncbi:innexin inx7 [Episyrphus balteatus]|uniref:innexin inx7 n=1 Tax=Episyrphus balteatus TaxID=286459 RepID=UPI0024865A71|nr:innexin inx7 [Episyrphus balteatus]
MLKTFESLKPFLHPTKVYTDNFLFKLHYRFTFIILLIATVLVTSRQYIGEHIKCISGSIPEHIINTFCFFTTTFTVVRHFNNTALDSGAIFQPGIGPYHFEEEPIKRHAYYQWVPFVLFGQALCFLVPHFCWKKWEGGRVKQLVLGFKMAGLSRYIHQKLKFGETEIPSMEDTEQRVQDIRREIKYRMRLNSQWGIHLMMAEWMNLFNIVLQIWWTDVFLSGQFYSLGFKVLSENWNNKMDILDVVFPKVTKCHFNKFGPSGSMQVHDTLCVMALNIINEKIYTILWFWFAFILMMSILAVTWRFVTLMMYKSEWFSEKAFRSTKAGRHVNKRDLDTVIYECNFSNWMFLYFLASNLSDFLFNKIIKNLAAEFSEFHPNPAYDNQQNLRLVSEKPGISSIDTVDGAPLLKGEGSKTD